MGPYHGSASEEMGCGEDGYSCSPSPPGPTAFTLPPVFSPPSTRIQLDDGNRRLTIVIVVSSALAACCLLLIYFIVLRYRRRSRRQRAAASVAMAAGPPLPPADVDDDLREELLMGMGGGGEPHHVWYIRTVGLDQGTIGAITVWPYKSGEGLVEGTDCAVCLGEFGDGELLRLLPKCSHAFHIPCIDTWLRSHLNCPLCRAPILAPPSPSLPPLPHPVTAPEISSEEGSGSDDDERGIAAALPPSQVEVAAAVAAEEEEEEEEESDIWVPIDLGDHAAAPVDAPQVQGNGGDGGPCPVPRSVSMDSSALAGLLLRMRLVGCSGDCRWKPSVGEDASSITEKGSIQENNCKVPSSLHAPLEMERSMSGGRFFFSRLSARTRGAILPL